MPTLRSKVEVVGKCMQHSNYTHTKANKTNIRDFCNACKNCIINSTLSMTPNINATENRHQPGVYTEQIS